MRDGDGLVVVEQTTERGSSCGDRSSEADGLWRGWIPGVDVKLNVGSLEGGDARAQRGIEDEEGGELRSVLEVVGAVVVHGAKVAVDGAGEAEGGVAAHGAGRAAKSRWWAATPCTMVAWSQPTMRAISQ